MKTPNRHPLRLLRPAASLLVLLALSAGTETTSAASAATPVITPPAATGVEAGGVSEADLLRRIRQAASADQERVNLLRVRGRYLEQHFEAASRVFDLLDAGLQRATAPLSPAAVDPAAPRQDAAPTVPESDPALDAQWRSTRDLLDILLGRRRSLEQQLAVLEAKRQAHEAAMSFLVAPPEAPALSTGKDRTAGPSGAAAAPSLDGDAASAAEPAPTGGPRTMLEALGMADQGSAATAAAALPPAAEVYDSRVARAERELQRQHAALRQAEEQVRLTETLVSLNQDELALVQAGMHLAQQHADALTAMAERWPAHAAPQPPAGAAANTATAGTIGGWRARLVGSARELQSLREAAARAAQAVQVDQQRIAALGERLQALKAIATTVSDALLAAEGEHEMARRRLAFLQSPLAPHRVVNWLVQALPRILLLLGVLAAVWLLGRVLGRRVADAALTRIRKTADEERVQRVQTLRRASRSVLTGTLVVVVALIVLPEFGVDATVLMGSAAVLSLALAFGAQSLIKDYFSGFMILSENQYRMGNVVRINELSGVVEDISLRMTMLRDAEGVAHFIPHSEIRTVSNLTHGWAQAVVDVRVGYGEDIDAVMQELNRIAAEMRNDAIVGPLILADPELWGVEALGESAVVVRLVMRTRPQKQWQVKRELLRRIKNRFDELGIEIPVQRVAVQMHAPPMHAPPMHAAPPTTQ